MMRYKAYRHGVIVCWTCCVLWGGLPRNAPAQLNQEPQELEGVEVIEHLDALLPLDLAFLDEEGKEVRLADYFTGRQPVILNLGYYRCPMLCGLILNGLLDGLKDIPLTAGKDFQIVTLSIDPLETPNLAKFKKQNVLKEYGRADGPQGWHFLTGKNENILKLTQAAGFGFKWIEKRKEFAHPAALILCTPDGRVSRYLYGIQFDPQTLRLSLVEASEGKIGSTFDHFLLTCFHYDPSLSRYAPVAMNIMRLGGGLTVAALGIFLGIYWSREYRKHRRRAMNEAQPDLHP